MPQKQKGYGAEGHGVVTSFCWAHDVCVCECVEGLMNAARGKQTVGAAAAEWRLKKLPHSEGYWVCVCTSVSVYVCKSVCAF